MDARQIADAVAHGDIAAVIARLDESQQPVDPEMARKVLVGELPHGTPLEVRMVSYQSTVTRIIGGSTTEISNVTFESKYERGYLVTDVLLRRVGQGERRILRLHVQAHPESMQARNAFSMAGKDLNQYTILVGMVATAVTTVRALVLWFRRWRTTRRKWLWLLAIFVGTFKLSIDWTTGAFAFQVLTIKFLPLSVMRDGPVGPWILSLWFPVGAIAFMMNASLAERRPAPVFAGPD
jgi:hypothetical protein